MLTSEDFERRMLPDWMNKDVKEIIEVAVMLGWKVHLSSAQSVTIKSHDDRSSWHFNNGRRATRSLNVIRKDVVKHADPRCLLASAAVQEVRKKDRALAELIASALPSPADPSVVVDHTEEDEQAKKEAEEKRQRALDAKAQQEKEQRRRALAQRSQAPDSPTIVSEKPMLASGGSERKQAYYSETTIERRWSDGTVDYKCSECDFTSPDRISPSRHYGMAHTKPGGGLKATPQRFQAEVPQARHYAPQQRRVDSLAEIIAGLMEQGERDPKVIAKAALVGQHEQSRHSTEDAAEREPMTPEETLDRIRLLLDDGTMTRITETVASLEQQVVDLTEAKAEAERKAEQAEGDLRALSDLVAEVTKRTDKAG